MLKKLLIVSLAMAAIMGPPPVQAQDANRWRFRQLKVDNDLFHFPYAHGGDQFYTSGLQVAFGKGVFDSALDRETLPIWLRPVRRACGNCKIRPNFSVGHQMFTPEDLEEPEPQPGERPWAAWLYAGFGGSIDTPNRSRHDIELQIGLTGDAAGGEFGQKFWHEVTGSPVPSGWEYQLGPDLGINANYSFQHIWMTAPADSRVNWDFVPSVKASVGTMNTNASVGGTIRIGPHIADFPFSTQWPTSRRNTAVLPKFEIHGFFGADARAVAYNYFLEGSLFDDEPLTVKPERYVLDFTLGFTLRYRHYNFSYAVVRRSEEFERTVGNRSSRHTFGSMSLTIGIR